jgi:hypothetical protein
MILNWVYKDKEITELSQFPQDVIGFVYKTTNTINGKIYIGKKSLHHSKKHKLTKKQLDERIITRGKKPTHETLIIESDWKTYYGSSKELIKDIKLIGAQYFIRDILVLARSKKELTLREVQEQFIYKVLEIESYNDNIAGRYFRKDIILIS